MITCPSPPPTPPFDYLPAEPSICKAIFTDADKAATAAIAQIFPQTLHKYCIFHTIQNVNKNVGGFAGGAGVVPTVVALFRVAAYATTEKVRDPRFFLTLLHGGTVPGFLSQKTEHL